MATIHPVLRTALFAALSVLGAAQGALAENPWIEVRTPHFVVISDADAARARELARQLERIRAFFGVALHELPLSSEPVRVFASEDEKSLASLVPEYRRRGVPAPAGLFRPGFGGNDIALRLDFHRARKYSVLYHEYFHALARENLGSLPLWLNEGLAQFWGDTVLRRDVAELGSPSVSTRIHLRRNRLIPLSTFFAVGYGSPHYTEPRKKSVFYAQAWALVHYLLVGDEGAHRTELTDYLEQIRRGADSVEAAENAFGDFQVLEKRLDEYRRARHFVALRLPAPPHTSDEDPSFSLRKLSAAEASALRADFLARGPSFRDAEPLATKALGLAPGLPLAHQVMSLISLRHQEQVLRRGMLEQVEPAVVPKPGSSPPVHSSASSATDYVELAYRYARRDRTLDRALTAVRKAAELDPGSSWFRSLVARVLWQSGRREEALETMREAVAISLRSSRAADANDLCLYGSLAGLADAVRPACDAAVEARPAVGRFRESRAVARAILGDADGAVDDFRAALADESFELTSEQRAERRLWIRRLEERKNPFDEEKRRELLGRPF